MMTPKRIEQLRRKLKSAKNNMYLHNMANSRLKYRSPKMKNKIYICNNCKYHFITRNEIKQHLTTKHCMAENVADFCITMKYEIDEVEMSATNKSFLDKLDAKITEILNEHAQCSEAT